MLEEGRNTPHYTPSNLMRWKNNRGQLEKAEQSANKLRSFVIQLYGTSALRLAKKRRLPFSTVYMWRNFFATWNLDHRVARSKFDSNECCAFAWHSISAASTPQVPQIKMKEWVCNFRNFKNACIILHCASECTKATATKPCPQRQACFMSNKLYNIKFRTTKRMIKDRTHYSS